MYILIRRRRRHRNCVKHTNTLTHSGARSFWLLAFGFWLLWLCYGVSSSSAVSSTQIEAHCQHLLSLSSLLFANFSRGGRKEVVTRHMTPSYVFSKIIQWQWQWVWTGLDLNLGGTNNPGTTYGDDEVMIVDDANRSI
mmetsp:Transcript_53253/g.129354  ORF Transcript_53253/g.129354 Transcript_53253/m.129354 type:complete len:138 (+) Transcript_53253:307-720(+)